MPGLPRPTILIVDDEEAVIEVVTRFAREAGFDVIPCVTGKQALERLANHRADVAAVDLRLPDIGGIEVLRAIREADPDCQVILMSADATTLYLGFADAYGFYGTPGAYGDNDGTVDIEVTID